MKWSEMQFSAILGGVSPEGVKYLKLFLQDVVNILHIKQPNASCNKCLLDYHNQFIALEKPKIMTESKYKLLAKREGVQLEFGSQIHVTNENLTDDYAKILIKSFKELNKDFKMEDLFEVYPIKEEKEIKETNITEVQDENKGNVQRNRKKVN